ncbi:MAG: conjugal transfer protein TraR [bacterium]|nr:conjugal transfer protein TraR [bacterium]
MRKTDQKKFIKYLNENKERLIENARKALAGDIHLDPDDFSDEIDSASSESGLAFVGRLRERERVLLQKIEAALAKIEAGTYGKCLSCGEDIGLKRLQARPVATLCIDCKSQQEKLEH